MRKLTILQPSMEELDTLMVNMDPYEKIRMLDMYIKGVIEEDDKVYDEWAFLMYDYARIHCVLYVECDKEKEKEYEAEEKAMARNAKRYYEEAVCKLS